MGKERRQIARGFEMGNGVELWLDGLQAALLNRGFVHASSIEAADGLRHRVALVIACRCLLKNRSEKIQIVFIEFAIDVPGGLVWRDRIFLLPAPAGGLVEIHARIDGFVDRAEIETRRIR